jgi:Zn-dependent M28 family amino/carboxypeptidase
VEKCPGIDDNGAGSVAVLEAARVLSPYKGLFNSTIYFTLFDLEEKGLLGSLAFTREYLIPEELMKRKNRFLGAYVADMLITYDPSPGSQRISYDIAAAVPEAYYWSNQNQDRGDFLCIWSRKNVDTFLFDQIKTNWNNSGPYKLLNLDPALPKDHPSPVDNVRYGTFMRSDHAAFWYPKKEDYPETLNAILLTDLGPWRSYQRKCYHSECDDSSQLNAENRGFMKAAVDAMVRSVYNLSL